MIQACSAASNAVRGITPTLRLVMHMHGVLRSLSVVLRWYRRLWAAVHVPGSFVIKP